MGIFKFPASLCDELSQIIRNFWWGDEDDRRKTHWLAWDKLTKPKREGGMGFRDLRLFNQAILAKQAWRLLVNPDSLCAKVLKAKYYPNGHILDTDFPQATSVNWQGIVHGLDLLKKEWAMEKMLIFGEIIGYQESLVLRLLQRRTGP